MPAGNTETMIVWKFKGLSDESIMPYCKTDMVS